MRLCSGHSLESLGKECDIKNSKMWVSRSEMDEAQGVARRELEKTYVHSVHKGDGEAGKKQLAGLSPFPRWEGLEIGGLTR